MSDDDLDAIRVRITPEQRALAREMLKHVHPAYDRATVKFHCIAEGTGILCIECKAWGRRSMLTKETAGIFVQATTPRCGR